MEFHKIDFNAENVKAFFSTIEEKSFLFKISDDVSLALIIDNVIDDKNFYVVHDVYVKGDRVSHLAYKCDHAPFLFISPMFYYRLYDWAIASSIVYSTFFADDNLIPSTVLVSFFECWDANCKR